MMEDEFIDQLRDLIEEAQEQLAGGRIAELMEEEIRTLRTDG